MSVRLSILAVLGIGLILAANNQISGFEIDVSPINAGIKNRTASQNPEGEIAEISPNASNQQIILARPLFMRDRRPFKPKPAAVVREPASKPKPISIKVAKKVAKPKPIAIKERQSPPAFKLHGILVDHETRKALVSVGESGFPNWHDHHSLIKGWKITVVSENVVKVSRKEISHKLELYVDNVEEPVDNNSIVE